MNHSKIRKMTVVINWLLLLTYLLLLAYWFFAVGGLSVEPVLFSLMVVSAIGLFFRLEWARKLLVASSGVTFVYILYAMIFITKEVDSFPILIDALCVAVIVYYENPHIKRLLQKQTRPAQWTVLLVDDDKSFLKMAHSHFVKERVYLLTAETGEKGIKLAKQWAPDLILLDVIMPGLKGREVCLKLKEDSLTKDIPVVFLTYKDSPDDIMAEMEVGAMMHLSKPISMTDLLKEVKGILGEHK